MKEISVRVFDDLDYNREGIRHEAAVTIAIGLDGTWRELDLTRDNEKRVREILEELMAAGSEPEETPAPSAHPRPYTKPDPERISFFEGLRNWCRETNRRNSSGSGWAYQTNDSLKYYYGGPLVEAYQDYLERQAQAVHDDLGWPEPSGGNDLETQ